MTNVLLAVLRLLAPGTCRNLGNVDRNKLILQFSLPTLEIREAGDERYIKACLETHNVELLGFYLTSLIKAGAPIEGHRCPRSRKQVVAGDESIEQSCCAVSFEVQQGHKALTVYQG